MAQVRAIIHVDMDAFYASVEQLDNPDLKGKPLIVAGLGRRGVVTTASYEARTFGVRSAMPTAQARVLCPNGIYLEPRMERYAQVSATVFRAFEDFTPEIEGLSLDEAFLDVSGSLRLLGDIEHIGRSIKHRVLARTGLTCSVGMAHNKLLAKLASELSKPNGMFHLLAERVQETLDPLPVGRLWTVGRVLAGKLNTRGIHTIGDLRRADPVMLWRALGRQGPQLQALAEGIDDRPVMAAREDKSIGAETTFEQDLTQLGDAQRWLMRLSERVGERVRKQGLSGSTVTLKLRVPPFETMTRRMTLDAATAATADIYSCATRLLDAWWQERKSPSLRLIGVTLSGFEHAVGQAPDLFSATEPEPVKDQLLDEINKRFGKGAIRRAKGLDS